MLFIGLFCHCWVPFNGVILICAISKKIITHHIYMCFGAHKTPLEMWSHSRFPVVHKVGKVDPCNAGESAESRGGSGKCDHKSPDWRLTQPVRGGCASTQPRYRKHSLRKHSRREKVTFWLSALHLSSTLVCAIPFWFISFSSRLVRDHHFNKVLPVWKCVEQGYASSCDFFPWALFIVLISYQKDVR